MSASRKPAAVADRVVVPAGTTGADAVAAAGLPTSGPKAIVVVRDEDGKLRDLDWAPEVDAEVEPVAIDSPAGPRSSSFQARNALACTSSSTCDATGAGS